jgi:hypothetical protein
MSRTRHWQAEARLPGGARVVFGVQARTLPGALLHAYRRLALLPAPAEHLTVIRLYGRHHPHGRRRAS